MVNFHISIWDMEDLMKEYEEEVRPFLDEAASPELLEERLWNDYPEWAYERLTQIKEENEENLW